MKKLSLFAFILALVLGASASTVNFAGLPAVPTPTLVPNGYGGLNWTNFYYVSPAWSGAGDGFRRGPDSLNLAYMGEGACEKEGASCSASISSNSLGLSPNYGFTVQSAIVAAGNHSETINVSAYNSGQFVGAEQYSLSTSLEEINFPAAWGTITQLVIDTNTGTVVLYALNIQSAGGSTSAKVDQKEGQVSPPIEVQGPSAVTRVKDPPPVKDSLVSPPIIVDGPNARGSQKLTSNDSLVSPPIIVDGPNARGSLKLTSNDSLVSPPIIVGGPNAPKTHAE